MRSAGRDPGRRAGIAEGHRCGFQWPFHPCAKKPVQGEDQRYATNLLKAGVGLDKVKMLLGHSSIQITVDTYGHFIPGKERQATLTDAMEAARQAKQSA